MANACFVDTNLLVYARDASEPEKQSRASEWLSALWAGRLGRISTQVLNEFYVTVTVKLQPGMTREAAWQDVQALMAWRPLAVDVLLLNDARALQQASGFSWWDSLIIAAARRSGSALLVSEDLQDGQDIDGTRIVNPFLHTPTDFGLASRG